jgi:hypothetical protein
VFLVVSSVVQRAITAAVTLLVLAMPTRGEAHQQPTDLRALLTPLSFDRGKTGITGAGARWLRFEVTGPIPRVWKRWRKRRQHGGWKLVLRYPTPAGQLRATLRKGKQLLTLSLARTRNAHAVAGVVSLVASRPTIRPRGRCKPVDQLRFEILVHRRPSRRRRFGRNPLASSGSLRSVRWVYQTRYVHDFDGDGLLDALQPLSKRAHCPGSVRQAIFITRCARGRCCGHRLGVLDGGRIDVAALKASSPDASGLRPIVTRQERTESRRRSRIPDRVDYTRHYRYRAGRYRLVRTQRRAGRCHHCRAPSCTGPINLRRCPLAWPDHLGFAALKQGLVAAAKRARRCLGRPLKDAKGGLLRVSLTVKKHSGRVAKLKVGDGAKVDAKTARCVRQALRAQRFARACADSNFSSPFRVTAQHPKSPKPGGPSSRQPRSSGSSSSGR